MTTGVLMVAVGEVHRNFAEASLFSLRKHYEGRVHVVTDSWEWFASLNLTNATFAPALPFCSMLAARREKLAALEESPFDLTFFADVDSHFGASPEQLFRDDLRKREIPNFRGIAMRPDGARPFIGELDFSDPVLLAAQQASPRFFPHWNSGAILYEKTPCVLWLFRVWKAKLAYLSRENPSPDQPALFLALLETGAAPALLPARWHQFHEPFAFQHWTKAPKIYSGENK